MGPKVFRDLKALSGTLAKLRSPQPRAFGSINTVGLWSQCLTIIQACLYCNAYVSTGLTLHYTVMNCYTESSFPFATIFFVFCICRCALFRIYDFHCYAYIHLTHIHTPTTHAPTHTPAHLRTPTYTCTHLQHIHLLTHTYTCTHTHTM